METDLEHIRQLAKARHDENWRFRTFLKGCDGDEVDEHRPADCASYPNLHKDGFLSRLVFVLNSYAVCPIVFNVYEHLKDEMGFQRRGRRRRRN